MNYQEVLEYMYAQLPMFHRIGPAAYKPGLDNTLRLLELVGNPQYTLKTVHVAGTNGKGSTSHLMASALQEAGYKTGLYTSPHLKDFRERIRINGIIIGEKDVVQFVNMYREGWQHFQPSFFEITVALCFWFFGKNNIDIAVIETGLGGRLDSTNVIVPEVAVITNVGFDHMNLLGNTIAQIASEKAGIIKAGIPAVLGPMRKEAGEIMRISAHNVGASVIDASLLDTDAVPTTSLQGGYQEDNRRTAYAALLALQKNGWQLNDAQISAGFLHVVENTGLLGRWQKLNDAPLIIADVAHNEDGIRMILDQIEKTPHRQLHFVLGMVGDKDVDRVLSLLPQKAIYYFCKADIPRGLDAQSLREKAIAFQLHGESYVNVDAAFKAAKACAQSSDMVFVGGSVFTVAEVL